MNATTELLYSLTVPPEWLLRLADARNSYIEDLGWPVTIEVTARQLSVAVGEQFDAITMPAGLGERVQAELRVAMLAGPVLADRGTGRWTFLTGLAGPESVVPERARAAGVAALPRHSRVVLPDDRVDAIPARTWVTRPRSRALLPPWPAVAATAGRVLARAA